MRNLNVILVDCDVAVWVHPTAAIERFKSRATTPPSMPTFLRSVWVAPCSAEATGSLFVWGEIQPQNRFESPSANGGGEANGKVPPGSSVTPPAMLRFQLRKLLPESAGEAMSLHKVAVNLPSDVKAGELARELPLHSRPIFGVLVPYRLAFRLLAILWQENEPEEGNSQNPSNPSSANASHSFQLGTDTLYWGVARNFALTLLANGCVLPAPRVREGRLLLEWGMWRGDPYVESCFEQLLALMPAVNLEYEPNLVAQVEGRHLLSNFLNAGIHATLVRRMNDFQKRQTPLANKISNQESAAAGLWQRLLVGRAVPVSEISTDLQSDFQRQWQVWTSRAAILDQSNVQVVFDLKAPSPGHVEQAKALWKLEFGVQQEGSAEDYLKAEVIWEESGRAHEMGLDATTTYNPRLHLLAGLRAAGRLWAPLSRKAEEAQPIALEMNLREAFDFLERGAKLLDAAGFKTIKPVWWSPQNLGDLRLVMQLRDGRSTLQGRGEENDPTDLEAFELEWQLALGEDVLSPSQVQTVAQAKSPLVFMNDQWLQLNESQIAAARVSLAHESRDQNLNLFQALRLLQEHSQPDIGPNPWTWSDITGNENQELPDLPVSLGSPEGRLKEVWDCLQTVAREESLEEPLGFVGALRPYQKRGLAWLWYLHEVGLGACLADDMGLGKTIQAIALFLAQEQVHASPGRIPRLLICPTSVLRNWQRELGRFAPGLRSCLHHGPRRADSRKFQADLKNYDVVLTSFGTARVDQETLSRISWHTLVVDEAQNIKNASTQQARAIRSFTGQQKIALTGTPIENRLSELWSVLDFVNRGYLGPQATFFQRYVRPIELQDDQSRLDHLKQIVQPFILRRLKSDPEVVSDLPEKQEITVTCDLTPEQTLLYAGAVTGARANLESLEGIHRRGAILALITKLKKITNHPALMQDIEGELGRRSGKLDRITEMLEETLENRNKALVFTTFVRMGEFLQRHLQDRLKIQADFLHGGINLQQRQHMVDRFQEGGQEVPILLLSLRTGGVGINLTAANQVFHYDRWWNPAVENQATDRAHRIGQIRRVQVFKFLVAGTIEEHVDSLIRSKTLLTEELLGSGEAWLTELSNERLFELLSLPLAETDLAK